MMKYIIIICVAVFTFFLGGRSMESAQASEITRAYAGEENMGTNSMLVPVKVVGNDTIYGPVRLPEVTVNMKRKG